MTGSTPTLAPRRFRLPCPGELQLMRHVGRGKPPQRLLDLGRGSYFGALELPPEQRALLVPSVYSRSDTTSTEGCTLMRVRRVEFDYRGGKNVLLTLAIGEAEAWIQRLKSHGLYRATNLDGFDRHADRLTNLDDFDRHAPAGDGGRTEERATSAKRGRSGRGGGVLFDAESPHAAAARGTPDSARPRRLRAISHDFDEAGAHLPAVGGSPLGGGSSEARPQSAAVGRAPMARPRAEDERAMQGLAHGSFRLALASSPASISASIASASAASLREASITSLEDGRAGGAGAPFGSATRRAVHRGGAVYWVRAS